MVNKIYEGKILAVDFDDTLFFTDFPKIIKPNEKVIEFVKEFKNGGGKIILNTCRHDEWLDQAVMLCKEQGIEFDKVNDNLDEEIAKYGNSRKVFAHYYLDDKAMKITDIMERI